MRATHFDSVAHNWPSHTLLHHGINSYCTSMTDPSLAVTNSLAVGVCQMPISYSSEAVVNRKGVGPNVAFAASKDIRNSTRFD